LPTSSERPADQPELALDCRHVTKAYRLGETLSLQRSLRMLVPGHSVVDDRFRALDDVTFSVARGDFFGIVGTNGSGKSTLTQTISGITVPTSGEVHIWGRVLPLLEVGAGFHDELTGRENVFLLGAILGLSGSQVRGALDAIVAFSGVERHIDTPMKRYSSGMKARLSFGTAICFPAETYVFDEVLAVVDEEFRNQCVAELQRLNAAGRTIIFMSHDLDLVREVCRSGMWLDKGKVRLVGSMQEVARAYHAGALRHATPVGG
jgi:ABC-type polysaccharide/polyol phosphate transport system ATPase subunit